MEKQWRKIANNDFDLHTYTRKCPTPPYTHILPSITTTLSHKIRQNLEAELICIDLNQKSHKQPPT